MSTPACSFFPEVQKGETVYSAFCRYQVRSQLTSGRILTAFLGRHGRAIIAALPTHVKPISSGMPEGHPWRDPRLIIDGHTTLPYFLYFRNDRARLIRHCIDGTAVYQKLGIGLATSPRPIPDHPRYCPQCAEEDEAEFGFSRFLREHQLPGVMVCWKHGGILANGCAACGPYPLEGYPLLMAGRCVCEDGIKPHPVLANPPENLKSLLWIAGQSKHMVDSPGTTCGDVIAKIRNKAVSRKITRTLGIDVEKFARRIESRIGRDVLLQLGSSVWRNNEPAPWVRKLLQGAGIEGKQTFHLLLAIGAFYDSIEEFERDSGEDDPPRDVKKKRPAPARKAVSHWGEGLCEMLKSGESLCRLARNFGVSEKKIAYEIRRQGLRLPLSPARIGLHRFEPIRRDLRDGIGLGEICTRNRCHVRTVLLIQLDDPDLYAQYPAAVISRRARRYREVLTAYLADHPDAGRTDLNREPKLAGVLAYLRRHDREWLLSRLPAKRRNGPPKGARKTRLDWAALDLRKAFELDSAFDRMAAPESRPEWLSRARMLDLAGIGNRFARHPGRLPLVADVLRRRAETREEYDLLRLKWAVRKIAEMNGSLSLKSILRVISIQQKKIHQHSRALADCARRYGVPIDDQSIFSNPGLSG